MINSLNPIDIKKRIDLNAFISAGEIALLWDSLNFKVLRFYNNGFKFKFVPYSYYKEIIKKEKNKK